jgi:hypothetical protein
MDILTLLLNVASNSIVASIVASSVQVCRVRGGIVTQCP